MKKNVCIVFIIICISIFVSVVVITGCSRDTAFAELPTSSSVSMETVQKTVDISKNGSLGYSNNNKWDYHARKPKLWDETIELTPQYHAKNDDFMSYLLYVPSVLPKGQKLPLLIWLHGSSQTSAGEDGLRASGLPVILESMTVQPNAFVLCPQLSGSQEYSCWHTQEMLQSVSALINWVLAEYPEIDTDNISIAGHSLGGLGSLYMAQKLPYIKRVASLSTFDPEVELTLRPENVRLYVGNYYWGEDQYCVTFSDWLSRTYGYPVYSYDCNHASLPGMVFAVNSETGEYEVFNWLLTN